MNDRIKHLLAMAHGEAENLKDTNWIANRFAELIVRECINQAHSVANLRGANDDMVYGADTAALRISKYFGVENEV